MANKNHLHIIIDDDLNEDLNNIKETSFKIYNVRLFKNHFMRIATKRLLKEIKKNPAILKEILKEYNYI